MPFGGSLAPVVNWADAWLTPSACPGGRRRGAAGGTRGSEFPGGRRGLLQGHGWRGCADPRRGQGPQHVAGVDRRQRSAVGQVDEPDLWRVRPLEDPVLV